MKIRVFDGCHVSRHIMSSDDIEAACRETGLNCWVDVRSGHLVFDSADMPPLSAPAQRLCYPKDLAFTQEARDLKDRIAFNPFSLFAA